LIFASAPTNGITLHVAQSGPETGPLLVLLHGFPECWAGWEAPMAELAALGWRVWAPDMRGYGFSDKPRGIGAYSGDRLVADVIGLIDAAGSDRAVVAGHDWGGVVAWQVALAHPGRVSKLVVVNAPHPAAMWQRVRSDWRQLARSWYVLAFQVPWLPERLAGSFRYRLLANALVQSSRPGTFDADLLARYRTAWSQPGAMRSMIHYYRAALRRGVRARSRRVSVPTLIIWGDADRFLVPELATDSARECDDVRVEPIPDATHWVLHEEPDRVVHLMHEFLGAPVPSPGARLGD
jgi:pimeloyl-ACP methyl ester carboxylesterase